LGLSAHRPIVLTAEGRCDANPIVRPHLYLDRSNSGVSAWPDPAPLRFSRGHRRSFRWFGSTRDCRRRRSQERDGCHDTFRARSEATSEELWWHSPAAETPAPQRTRRGRPPLFARDLKRQAKNCVGTAPPPKLRPHDVADVAAHALEKLVERVANR